MEIVTRDGMTFLSPVVERDNIQINSYHKWEQAYHVFSNILTTKYPEKVTELFQYGHTIQMAASAYVWDNVYGYDKEFHHHISRHPTRSWAIILQQAWTMLLKDRVVTHISRRGTTQEVMVNVVTKRTVNPVADLTKEDAHMAYLVTLITGVQ